MPDEANKPSVTEPVTIPDQPSWERMINEAALKPQEPTVARTYIKKWGSDSEPVHLKASDGKEYVVKGLHAAKPHIKKVLSADGIVGMLGKAIGAPAPRVVLIEVPKELVDGQPEMKHL